MAFMPTDMVALVSQWAQEAGKKVTISGSFQLKECCQEHAACTPRLPAERRSAMQEAQAKGVKSIMGLLLHPKGRSRVHDMFGQAGL